MGLALYLARVGASDLLAVTCDAQRHGRTSVTVAAYRDNFKVPTHVPVGIPWQFCPCIVDGITTVGGSTRNQCVIRHVAGRCRSRDLANFETQAPRRSLRHLDCNHQNCCPLTAVSWLQRLHASDKDLYLNYRRL